MNDFLLIPFVVALGIVGFLITTRAVSIPAVLGVALVVLLGACSQARRNTHPRTTSPRSAWTSPGDMSPAATADRRSPMTAHWASTSATTFDEAMSFGSSSAFSELSAPTAATKAPGDT